MGHIPKPKMQLVSTLPPDLLCSHIITYLDAYSATMLLRVSTGLKSICSSDTYWKSRCASLGDISSLQSELSLYDSNWKRLYLEKPRIRCDGVYISKCCYFRSIRNLGNVHLEDHSGGKSRSDAPFIMVTYYRYILFLQCGVAFVLRSEVEPKTAVRILKSVQSRTSLDNNHETDDECQGSLVASGVWAFEPSTNLVNVIYKEPLKCQTVYDRYDKSIILRLSNYRHTFNSRLVWEGFSYVSHSPNTNDEGYPLNVKNDHFRPFIFNRIRQFSYRL